MTTLTDAQIARVAHEANRAYCASLHDFTQVAWDDAPDWQRGSAISGVAFHREHPEATPEQSHESWLAIKREEGWTYGPVKDPARKLHPCFLKYAELPEDQRRKDALFLAIVRSLLA